MSCPDDGSIAAFVEGGLSPDRIGEVAAHLANCAACRDLVAAVAPAMLGKASQVSGGAAAPIVAAPLDSPAPDAGLLARGAAVGRYVILNLVGRGGMGDVYAAYDPELDRRVALKLLKHEGPSSESPAHRRGRLLKEAKAIARLSHPNVVVVHDAGTIDDRVFIAMEFVEGQTLGAWLGGKPRAWPEIRAVFLAAGRGLAAAHAAHIVHRDFKPANVMVTADGAVRVMDFGLASEDAPGGDGELATAALPDHTDFARTMTVAHTRTGALIGTPAFMAPEQFRTEHADPRTDQFSFCVSLYEALYGERPFDASSLPTLVEAVLTGRLREPPARVRVPAWLRKVVLRGLSTKREHRYPSMEELLTALARDPERQRRRAMIGAATMGILVAIGAFGQRTLGRSGAALCRGGAERLASVWELPSGDARHPRRDATRAAFVATAVARAADVWERTAAALDEYARKWIGMYAETCEATHVRGEQSPEVLDLRMDCLNRNRDDLRALTDVFAGANAVVVNQAIDAARSLPEIARCADVAVLRAVIPPPKDRSARERVESLRRRAADARAQGSAGRYHDAMAGAEAVLNEARAVGYRPLVAEASSLSAWLHGSTGDPARAVKEAEAALWAAEATRHDEVAAEAAVLLVGIVGAQSRRPDEAELWASLAEAILARMGPGHDRLKGWLAHDRGGARVRAGRLDAAEADLREALALKQKLEQGEGPDVAQSRNMLAELLAAKGDLAGAVAEADRTRAIFDRTYGPGGVMSARSLCNRCEYLNALGRHSDALESCREAIRILEAAFGGDHVWIAFALTNSAVALGGLHRSREAVPVLRRALEMTERADPDPVQRADARFALARALWDAGDDRSAARAMAEEARSDYGKTPNGEQRLGKLDAWLAAHRERGGHRGPDDRR